jgi:Glycosyl hydrolase family 12
LRGTVPAEGATRRDKGLLTVPRALAEEDTMRVTRPISAYLLSVAAAGVLAACGGQEDLQNPAPTATVPVGGATSSPVGTPSTQPTMPGGGGTTPTTTPSNVVPGMTTQATNIPPGSSTPGGMNTTPVPMTTDSSGVVPSDTTVIPMTSTSVPVDGAPGPGFYISKDWQGCAWTGTDTIAMPATTLTPQDFTGQAAGEPFCIKGSVGPDPEYNGVALLGFNLNEPPGTSCVHEPVDPNAPAQPSVMKTAEGIAVDFAKQGTDTSFTLRLQIQGPNGHKDGEAGAADRWCANITEPNGKFFVPWGAFDQQCWFVDIVNGVPVSNSEDYPTVHPYAGEPLSAVVFTVPGNDMDAIPYEFCVNGWAYGSSAADAPDGSAMAGTQTGVLVDSSAAGDSPRAKVNVDGENYVVQPNAWGTGASLTLEYTNNSFVVQSAGGSGDQAPASFPSLYVGSNGFTMGGQYATKTTDNLPLPISQIASANTTFRWSGNNGEFNAAYDVWFANTDPMGQRYNDGLNGFVMVWLHKPGSKSPIGTDQGDEMIANQTWDVWKGNRGSGPSGDGADLMADPNAPVISFVVKSSINSLTFDLKDFIDVAVSKYGLPSTLLLTDVFAGFEIWNGGTGLKVDEFKMDVQKN